jgi:short-subunit dehydrogenase
VKGVRVLITGASSGIGEATAYRFAREGASLGLLARRRERLMGVAEKVRQLGGRSEILPADVARRDELDRAVSAAEAAFDGIDVLVNNAGFGLYASLEEVREEDLRRLFEVNVFGAIFAIQAVLPGMKQRGSGVLINVSSVVGKRALPMSGAYGATKFALQALSESLRLELAGTGVRVSVVCPGYTATEFGESAVSYGYLRRRPRGASMSASEVAEVIWRAARNPPREVVLTGKGKLLVYVNRFFPAVADWMLARYMGRPAGRGVSSQAEERG